MSVRFVRPDLIRYDSDCFSVRGQDIFLFSGEVHYFRVPEPLWEDRLIKVRRANLNALTTYVPWNWHERKEGESDFSDLERYMSLAERMGLLLLIRPGPYICSEWDMGGFPRWLADAPFTFRTDHPESIIWSDRYYSKVMPLIASHQITKGGNVILVQLENEYDYSGFPEDLMERYLKSLYESACRYGIEVPFYTCWTRVARKNSDPIMAQIMDTCNFYTGWDFEWTAGAISKLKEEEPDSPAKVTELQGGWFSTFGDHILPHQREDLSPAQCDALTKFVIAHGISAINYYMFFGGTNFGYWGAKHITTTYDYSAPIREPGGLWDKYYRVKLIGDFLRCFGKDLVRARPGFGASISENEAVRVFTRMHEDHGYIFLWNPTDSWQSTKVTATMPDGNEISIETPISLAPRSMKLLPILFSVGPHRIAMTNLEVQGIAKVGGRWVLLLYGDPMPQGSPYEICLFDGKGVKGNLREGDSFHILGDDLLLVVTSRRRASRTWRLEPIEISLEEWLSSEAQNGLVISDAYLLRRVWTEGKRVHSEWDLLPGKTGFTAIMPDPLRRVIVNGRPIRFRRNSRANAVRFSLRTESLPVKAVRFEKLLYRPEPVEKVSGNPLEIDVSAMPLEGMARLESMGMYENGFYRYEADFEWNGEEFMLLRSYAPDPKLVLIDGKSVPEASGSGTISCIPLRRYARPGTNRILILYEQQGRVNGGKGMQEPKGIAGVALLPGDAYALLNAWRMRDTEGISEDAEEIDPNYDDSSWAEVKAEGYQLRERGDAWFRTDLYASESGGDMALIFEGVDDSCWIWLNGRKIAEHHGWDEPFMVRLGEAVRAGRNVLVVGVKNISGPGGIYAPVHLLNLGKAKVISGWKVEPGLYGERWIRGRMGKGWKGIRVGSTPSEESKALWYRVRFRLARPRGWNILWKLLLLANGDGNIWLNGIHIGRYKASGPQKEFYLPECYLRGGDNEILIFLWNAKEAPVISEMCISPYEEFSTKRVRISFEKG